MTHKTAFTERPEARVDVQLAGTQGVRNQQHSLQSRWRGSAIDKSMFTRVRDHHAFRVMTQGVARDLSSLLAFWQAKDLRPDRQMVRADIGTDTAFHHAHLRIAQTVINRNAE